MMMIMVLKRGRRDRIDRMKEKRYGSWNRITTGICATGVSWEVGKGC